MLFECLEEIKQSVLASHATSTVINQTVVYAQATVCDSKEGKVANFFSSFNSLHYLRDNGKGSIVVDILITDYSRLFLKWLIQNYNNDVCSAKTERSACLTRGLTGELYFFTTYFCINAHSTLGFCIKFLCHILYHSREIILESSVK